MPQDALSLIILASPSWPLACATIDIQIMAELKNSQDKTYWQIFGSDTGLNCSFHFSNDYFK